MAYCRGMAKNKVFLNPQGIIEIEVIGDQNAASVELMGRAISVLIVELKGKSKPVLILDDLFQMGEVDSAGRKLVVDFAKRLDYTRLAMVGKGGVLRIGANLMLRATGKGDTIRYFNDRQAAIEWLQVAPLS